MKTLPKISFFAILLLGFIFLWACRKNEVENRTIATVNYYYSYFPIYVGSTYIYKVDSLVWNTYKFKYDTSSYYLKEQIDSPFIDLAGDQAFKVYRWWTKDTTMAWTGERVWTEKTTKNEAQRWEENIRYLRLYFPVKLNYAWNGNKYNNIDSFKEYNYFYKEVHKPFSLAGISYDSTVLVSQINYTDALESHIAQARYAAKVGLIYREESDTSNVGNGLTLGSYFTKQTLLKFTK
jgi:hypothetical protein